MEIKKFDIILDNYKNPRLIVDDIKKWSKDISDSYDNSEKMAEMIYDIFDVEHKAIEYVWLVSMTSDCHIIGVFEVFRGSINASLFSPREIMMSALLSGASQIILAHCHPSGSPEPSMDDDLATFKLKKLCDEMRVPLMDHIIVAHKYGMNYYSYAKESRFVSV